MSENCSIAFSFRNIYTHNFIHWFKLFFSIYFFFYTFWMRIFFFGLFWINNKFTVNSFFVVVEIISMKCEIAVEWMFLKCWTIPVEEQFCMQMCVQRCVHVWIPVCVFVDVSGMQSMIYSFRLLSKIFGSLPFKLERIHLQT